MLPANGYSRRHVPVGRVAYLVIAKMSKGGKFMSDNGVIRFEANGPGGQGLGPCNLVTPETLIEGNPTERIHTFFTSVTGQLTAGVWTCTPCTEVFASYPVDEFMQVLEGRVVVTGPDGVPRTFEAGDAFVIAKGTPLTWKIEETMRKYYVIFEHGSEG